MAKIAIAMSGGVDSSVAALLLKQAGHELVGLSLHLNLNFDLVSKAGAKIANQLNFHHLLIKGSQIFTDMVIRPSVISYAAGLTPNPCVLCNSRVKLPLLWNVAQKIGFNILATGHYACLYSTNNSFFLAESVDIIKSQVYFLARVAPALLYNLCFPLAKINKSKVWSLAVKAGLDIVNNQESQDICFLPSGGWDELITRYAKIRNGVLKDIKGNNIGYHYGLHKFTIGQRGRLGVALGYPQYVLAIDKKESIVRIGAASYLWAYGLDGKYTIWYTQFNKNDKLKVRIRYTHKGTLCRIYYEAKKRNVRVYFKKPQRAVTPGQLAIFMQDNILVGSTWIYKAIY